MKYKYSTIFVSTCAILLLIFLVLSIKNFSETDSIPLAQYDPSSEIEEMTVIKTESWNTEIPPTIRNEIEVNGDTGLVPYRNEKFGFEILVPNGSYGHTSEGGLHNDYYVRLQNYTDEEILNEYVNGKGAMKEGWYFLEMYIQETSETDTGRCVSEYEGDYLEVDLGQGIKGFMSRPGSYGGDDSRNGVTICTIKDGYEFDVRTREDVILFDDEIVKTFKFID